jgi:hypothetical protein
MRIQDRTHRKSLIGLLLAGRTDFLRTTGSCHHGLVFSNVTGYHGAAVFSNPGCRLLDLNPDHAKAMGIEAHWAGLLNLRAVGEVIELSFPSLAKFQES